MIAMKIFIHSFVLLLIVFATLCTANAQSSMPSAEQQIRAAVSPAPEHMQDGATVLGYISDGELVTLREGGNELICLADDPTDDRFHVACYHKDLEPFMKRGRELRAKGHPGEEVVEIRREEIESGELYMPEHPTTLYSLTGEADGWDYSTDTLREARPLYVVYIPYATVEETGLASRPVSEGAPWLMDAGTPWAHIMVGTGRILGTEAGHENGE